MSEVVEWCVIADRPDMPGMRHVVERIFQEHDEALEYADGLRQATPTRFVQVLRRVRKQAD